MASFEHFHEARVLGDRQVAALARDVRIDIAVDLAGFTQGARPGIFAARAAPLQVNYIGFPGTLGAPFIDYVLADEVVVPPESRDDFSEAVAWLPNAYLPNAAWQPVAAPELRRGAAGLPDEGFVFCSFNNSFKITPDVFDVWMRLLHGTPGSVLWLIEANGRCRQPAARSGAARRRRRAGRVRTAHRAATSIRPAPARRSFLDTFHYGAHTTASDALRAGCRC
jgi:predicted O-linked N-acetylglucosamine transferase (SPINDLY family)